MTYNVIIFFQKPHKHCPLCRVSC